MNPIAVTGGVTGGHVLPAISVALGLKGRGHHVIYVGAPDSLEAELVPGYGIPFCTIPYQRRARFQALTIFHGFTASLALFFKLRPRLLFSTGSQVAIPAVLAAAFMRIPVVLHESDVIPGPETDRLQALARLVCLGSSAAASYFRGNTLVTGNPTRPNLLGGKRDRCLRTYGLSGERPIVLIMGGSQGAERLNLVVRAALDRLTETYTVIHVCGPGKRLQPSRLPYYVALEFVHDEIRDIYAAADVAVTRAGATSIAELGAYRIPALYVPYPTAHKDHQTHNAQAAAKSGLGVVIAQRFLTPERMLSAVGDLLASRWPHRPRAITTAPITALTRVLDAVESRLAQLAMAVPTSRTEAV